MTPFADYLRNRCRRYARVLEFYGGLPKAKAQIEAARQETGPDADPVLDGRPPSLADPAATAPPNLAWFWRPAPLGTAGGPLMFPSKP